MGSGGPTPRTPLPPPGGPAAVFGGGGHGAGGAGAGDAGAGGGAGGATAVDVLRLALELMAAHGLSARACFDHFDSDRDGVWDRAELYELVCALAPTLPVKGRFAVIDALAGLDPEGAGRVSYPHFKSALRLLGAQVSPTAPRVPRSLSKEAILGKLGRRAGGPGETTPAPPSAAPAPAERPPPARALQKKSSSILLADALFEANIGRDDTPPPRAGRDGEPAASAPPAVAAPGGRQPFLATSSCELALMVQEDLGGATETGPPFTLQEVFDRVYADGARFYELNKCDADIDISVSDWAESQVHSGAVRAVRLKTMHTNLGLLSTLDLQRHAWGPGRRWLAVEHRTVTPTLPHGDKWRVEKRCTFAERGPAGGGCQAVIAAAVHVVPGGFPQSEELRRAVERTLAEDARVYLNAVRETLRQMP